MRALTGMAARFFKRRLHLTSLERTILDAVERKLPVQASTIWQGQVKAIYLVQRLPDGIEVDFYMRDPLRGSGNALPRFQNQEEFVVATVQISLPSLGSSVSASVWCVSGRLFSIEYKGSIKYFEEAIGMDPAPDLRITVAVDGERLS